LKRQVRLRDAYWFAAIAVYPDLYGPTVQVGDVTMAAGGQHTINLLDAIHDADNMAALAVTTATSANDGVARARVRGMELLIDAVAPGQTTVTLTTDSNGKQGSGTFTVTVTAASTPGDVNMDGKVTIDDITTLIDVLLGSQLANYDPAAADVNGDKRITIDDLTTLIDKLLSSN